MNSPATRSRRESDEPTHTPLMAGCDLEKLLQHLPGVFFQYRMHPDGRHTFPYVSRDLQDLLDVPPAAAVSDAAAILSRIHPDDLAAVVVTMTDAAERLHTWQLQFRMFDGSGCECWIEVAAAPAELPDGTLLWSGYARNVNERKQLEEALREAQEDLIRLSEERTQRLLEANTRLSALNDEIKAEIKERIQLEKTLQESYDLLSSLAADLVRSEERERRRIAAELHDDVVQHLALGKLRLDHGLKNGAPATDLLEELSLVMVKTMQQIREICNDLSPPVLYDFGLPKALQSLGDGLIQKSVPHMKVRYELDDMELPDSTQVFLYQTARELLVNAIKHARAGHLRIVLKRQDALIRLVVEDDGAGFPAGSKPGFGLSKIQQRVLFHKGTLSIASPPGGKTAVTVEIPATSSKSGPQGPR